MDSTDITMELVYDPGYDGIASVGDSVKLTVNMLNQPPDDDAEEILNELWGANYNGVYIFENGDFDGFDAFNQMTYPFYLFDDPINEVWDTVFQIIPGNLDVDPYDLQSRIWITAEDNIGHSPDCTPPADAHLAGDIGNRNKVQSITPPFGIDNDTLVHGVAYYDLDTGGDATCPNEINIGDRIRIWIDLSMNTDTITTVTVDMLNSELGGTQNQVMYDDGTNGDDTADDKIFTYEWTIPAPATGGTDNTPGTHYVVITYADDGGNWSHYAVYTLRGVDTELPDPVENLTAVAMPGGSIKLDWDHPSGTTDEYEYHIYSDGGTGVIDYVTEVGHRFHPDTEWESDPLTHGTLYCFGIRVEDNACNMDTNNWIMACATADAEPPTAAFINPLDVEAFCGPVQVVVQSPDEDIDKFKLWYRQKDVDPGTAGDQPGPWTYGITIENDGEFGTGTWDPTGSLSDGEYEGVVCGIDLAGNEQDTTTAYDAGQTVSIIWDTTPPSVFISTVNGEAPSSVTLINGNNTMCIYAVDNLADSMMVWMEIWEDTKRDTLKQGWVHKDDISPTNHYCFEFSLANWHNDNATLNVWVFDTDSICNKGIASLTRPVEDIYPVVATMTKPLNYERVMWTATYPVQARFLAGSPVDEVTLVQFQERPHGEEDWTTYCTDYSPSGTDFDCIWDNTAYEHNAQVDLRALFYDDAIPANVETTFFITVTVDKYGPVIELMIENLVDVDGVPKLGGTQLDLIVEYLGDSLEVDIDSVVFWHKECDQSELQWSRLGKGMALYGSHLFPAGWSGNISGWDTTCHEIKAVPWDASGNEGTVDIDTFWYDKSAPQVAINLVRTGTSTMEFVNPSTLLGGSGKVYAQAWEPICFWHLITNPYLDDTLDVDFVRYAISDHNLGDVGLNDSLCFNPLEEGLLSQADLESKGYANAYVNVTLFDILGNVSYDNTVQLWVLDVTGNQVVVINPDNGEYHRDEIQVRAASINDFNLASVTYWYRAVGATEWIELATVTDPGRGGWGYRWYTRNNVQDGWYEIVATSVDKYGNPSEPGPINRVFIGNTPPISWMASPEDSVFLGPNLDMRPGPGGNYFDAVVSAYARALNEGGCPIDYLEFGYKPITSDDWDWLKFDDDLTYFDDSLYGRLWNIKTSGPDRVYEGWCHVVAVAYDSCGNMAWSTDTVSVYMDLQSPFAEIIGVNDNHFPYNMDLGGPPYEDTLKARAWDPMGERALRYTGFASGLDSLQFMIYKGSCGDSKSADDIVFFGAVYEPNDSAQYEMIWNSEGADTGTYCWYCQTVDKVRNRMRSDGVPLRIEDYSQRVATIRAFHDGEVYATVNMKGVTGVTFQYFSLASSHWVNFGLAEPINPTTWTWGEYNYPTATMWYTPWDPTTLTEGFYLVRCLTQGPWEQDWYGERKPGLAKPFSTSPGPVVRIHVDAQGNVHPAETEDIDAISFRAVLETGTKGVVKVEAQSTPYLFAIYSHGAVEVERISLTKETGTDIHNGTFEIPWSSSEGGDVRFYASVVPDTTYIEMGGFDITVVDQYLGTNGPIEFVDGSASIDIPGGAIRVNELNLVGYPTAMPPVVANECKKYTPVGNADGLIWKYYLFGYSADTNLDDYAKITLYYDETQITVPESELQVARWDYEDYCWEFSHVESPVVDEANHSITFWTDHLGTFAVIQTPVAMWASVEVDPNCSDYSNDMPCFVSYIQSEYGDIDHHAIEVKLGPVGGTMKTIYYDDTFADGYCSPFANWEYSTYEWQCSGSAWDPISGELDLCIMDPIKALVAGEYVIFVEAYDQVGNYASAVDTFTVDVKVPKITFLNGYVGKNPEFSFTIEDAESGVDTSSIYIDMYSVTKVETEYNSWVENRRYLGTYTPAQIDIIGGVVDITTTLELVNNQAFDVVIYDGTYENSGAPAEQDDMRIYHPGHGPGDCVGNQADPVYQRFAIDDQPPTFSMMTSSSARPIKVKIMDEESGINWNTFKFFENGTEIDPDSIDQNNGIVHYTPDNIGVDVEMNVEDNMNNLGYYNLTTEAEELTLTNVKNYPNPFDNYTVIAFDLSRRADVVIKLYDFSGELVKTLVPGDYYNAGHVTEYWYGATDDGEDVANGIYLCHIEANDGSHTASEVIKIAAVRKD